MAFFEGLSKIISETGTTAVNKTKEVTEIARLNGAIATEEKAIKEAYAEIGRRYAEKYASEPEEAFADQIAIILEANEKIENYRRNIEDVKGTTICPNCGREVERNKSFCGNCGAKLPQANRESSVPENTEE